MRSFGLHPDLLEFLNSRYTAEDDITDLLAIQIRPLEGDDKLHIVLEEWHDIADMASIYEAIHFDPAAAVHRQACFGSKMIQFGWLHSPKLLFTLQRARKRYLNFFSLIAEGAERIVPALDIDLVWHTHQLSPAEYTVFSKAVTHGRFIDHNDMAEEGDIISGGLMTQNLYLNRFREEYLVCHSWYCEASRLVPGEQLSDTEQARIQQLIEQERERKRQLGLLIAMDMAECYCHFPSDGESTRSLQRPKDGSCSSCWSFCF
jgi:Glycine-rich domain-containing protein-like